MDYTLQSKLIRPILKLGWRALCCRISFEVSTYSQSTSIYIDINRGNVPLNTKFKRRNGGFSPLPVGFLKQVTRRC